MEDKKIDIISELYLSTEHDEAYKKIESILIPNTVFTNRFGRKIIYLGLNSMCYKTRYIRLQRESGNNYETTFFKFSRDIKRGNLRIIKNQYRSYKKKKLIINI